MYPYVVTLDGPKRVFRVASTVLYILPWSEAVQEAYTFVPLDAQPLSNRSQGRRDADTLCANVARLWQLQATCDVAGNGCGDNGVVTVVEYISQHHRMATVEETKAQPYTRTPTATVSSVSHLATQRTVKMTSWSTTRRRCLAHGQEHCKTFADEFQRLCSTWCSQDAAASLPATGQQVPSVLLKPRPHQRQCRQKRRHCRRNRRQCRRNWQHCVFGNNVAGFGDNVAVFGDNVARFWRHCRWCGRGLTRIVSWNRSRRTAMRVPTAVSWPSTRRTT